MLDGGKSSEESTLASRKGSTRRSSSYEKFSIKDNREKCYIYYKWSRHIKDNCFELLGREKVLERIGGHQDPAQVC